MSVVKAQVLRHLVELCLCYLKRIEYLDFFGGAIGGALEPSLSIVVGLANAESGIVSLRISRMLS